MEDIWRQRQKEMERKKRHPEREREGATSLSADGADEYWRRRLR